MFTGSQIIAALVDRLGGGPITLTVADVTKWGTKWPVRLLGDDDGVEITVFISPDTLEKNQRIDTK